MGEVVSLAALGGRRGAEEDPVEAEGEEGGRPQIRMYFFPRLSLVRFSSLSPFLLFGERGEQEIRGPHVDGGTSHGFAGDCWTGTGLL